MTLVKITLKKESQILYSLYRPEGWYGFIVDKDSEHIWIKHFGTDINDCIYFGSIEKICNHDINTMIDINI
jgi:hypothetical protein